MKIHVTVESSHLVVQVGFDNQLSENVYLMTWLMDWYGLTGDPTKNARNNKNATPTRELAYVCLGPHGEAVLLNGDGPSFPAGEVITLPDGTLTAGPAITPTVPRLPYGLKVTSGQSFNNTLRLPLPLCEWYAYGPPTADKTVPVTIFQLRYRLETVRESASGSRKPVQHPSFPGVWRVRGYPADVHEVTASLTEPITLLKRTGPFQRFG